MPSWEIHEKYSNLMGIPINVAREVNRFIDDVRWHDFFDSALTRSSTSPLRVLGGRIVTYNFDSSLFYTPTYEPIRQWLEKYGRDGFRAFFLHIFLDLIERNMRSGIGFAALQVIDTCKFYENYIEEVENFLQSRIEEILADIEKEIHSQRS
jgi:triphosphoribosyl-dephospho-CoA synthetase